MLTGKRTRRSRLFVMLTACGNRYSSFDGALQHWRLAKICLFRLCSHAEHLLFRKAHHRKGYLAFVLTRFAPCNSLPENLDEAGRRHRLRPSTSSVMTGYFINSAAWAFEFVISSNCSLQDFRHPYVVSFPWSVVAYNAVEQEMENLSRAEGRGFIEKAAPGRSVITVNRRVRLSVIRL